MSRVFLQPRLFTRTFAKASSAIPGYTPAFQVFNRNVKRMQRDRSAINKDASRKVDYLRDEIANRLVERLLYINRTFNRTLDLGAGACHIARALSKPQSSEADTKTLQSRVSHIICADQSDKLLYRDIDIIPDGPSPSGSPTIERIICDEETVGSHFSPNTFDAVLSSLSMHWINDLPSLLSQVNTVLLPDSPLIASMFGGDTLYELRTSLQLAESERRGGVSPRVSPLADVRDMGGLLQRAGFTMLTIDVDDIIVSYPDIFALMTDLQQMGEGNAVLGREPGPIGRDVLMAAQGIYQLLHGGMGENGGLPATFRIIYMIGWKAGPSQQKPLARGSGETSLKDVLENKK